MTRARITAAQATRPPKGMRMHRGTVTVVSPLTVQIAGGGAVTGLAVPGQRYAVGDAVLVAVQEPAVGPVYPLTPTPAPDLTLYAKTTDLAPYAKTTDLSPYAKTTDLAGYAGTSTGTLAYSGTTADWSASWRSRLTKVGPLANLSIAATVGATAPALNATIATIPAGFRPAYSSPFPVPLYNNGWGNQTAILVANTDGTVQILSSSVTVAAGYGLFGVVTYPTA